MNIEGKRLLILGGSRISKEIVLKAKDLGLYVLVTDWYPLEKSPAKQIADEALYVSTADVDAVVKLIEEKNIDGVITGFTDSVLPYYADICKKSGLPCYGTKEQFETLINKNNYKKLCREFGVPTVEEYIVDEDTLGSLDLDLKFPVLVKPADNSGARGIRICHNVEQLREAYNRAIEFSDDKEVLVERYIDGEEVTIFWLFQDGKYYLSGMGNRHVKHREKGIIPLPVAYTFPSIYIQRYQKEVEPNVHKMLKSMGIRDGMMFMQCLVEDGNCIVYDIGFRLTGSLEYKLQEAICGYNPLEMMIRFAVEGRMSDYDLSNIISPYWGKYACNISFLGHPGVIKGFEGIDNLIKVPGVIDATLAYAEGDEILKASRGTLRQIVLRAFGEAGNIKDLEVLMNQVYNSFDIISDKGESLKLEGLDTSNLNKVLVQI